MKSARATSRSGKAAAVRRDEAVPHEGQQSSKVRAVIVDSRTMIAEGLSCLLSREPGVEVVRCCSNATEALKTIRLLKPDVVLVALRMPIGSGLDLLRGMRKEAMDTPFVLLADFLRDDETMDALRLGTGGIVLEDMPPGLLVQCLRVVARNEQWFEKLALGRALEKMLRQEEGERSARVTLTRRELEVVKLVAAGLRNKDIAVKMSIGEGTVKLYLNTIFRKLEVDGRVALARHAHKHHLI